MASLSDLGLSEYESRTYRALLRTGPTTAKELSRVSDVPMGRIYDVLNSLETHKLVRSQEASRPKKYVAVEPETALDRLLEEKKRDLREQATQYEDIVTELTDQLESAKPGDDQFWTAALGPDDAADLLVERLAAADDSIVIVADSPTPQFDIDEMGERVLAELEAALERDVTVSLLLGPELVEALPESVGNRYRDRHQERPEFAVRTSPDVYGTFEVIDGHEVCIEIPHPLEGEQIFGVIDLKDAAFATGVSDSFQPRWEGAQPLEL
ncbi:MAG: sugar-specific transcriptional regulator TrmB [Haloarculaceae archaeon]|jgi:sugar-specific transcriptional regulator TrmB